MTTNPGPRDEESPASPWDSPWFARALGVVLLTLCALVGYLVVVAHYLDADAYAPADHALVTGLRVLAGACAIPALACTLGLLNLRDRRIMREQDAARKASADRARGRAD